MSQLHLNDVVNVLVAYKEHFGYIDVFADSVVELAEQHAVFESLGSDRFRTLVTGRSLELQMFRGKNVARFHLNDDTMRNNVLGGALAGAAAGGLFGAVADSGSKRQEPAGVVFGLLLGAVLGSVAGSAVPGERRPRHVLTLRYDAGDGQWKVYHGPYLNWAKEALRVE
jgi:hypothetical protein